MKKLRIISLFIILYFQGNGQSLQFEWAQPISGNGAEVVLDVQCDGSGNVYTLGTYSHTFDADPGPGIALLTENGTNHNAEVFIIKYNNNGNFIWAKSVGGESPDFAFSLTIDSDNNLYALGYYIDTADFDPGIGNFTLITDTVSLFLLKLDSAGNFIWAKDWNTHFLSQYSKVIIDATGDVFICADFRFTLDSDPGAGVHIISPPSQFTWLSSMMVKLDSSGNHLSTRVMAGAMTDITFDPGGNLITTGWFFGNVDFDVNSGQYILSANLSPLGGSNSLFIAKYDAQWNLIWAHQMQGTPYCIEYWYRVICDQQGNIYCTGGFRDTVDFDPGPGINYAVSPGGYDAFVSKYDNSGSFQWVKHFGTSQSNLHDYAFETLIDNSNNLLITGQFNGSTDFDPGIGVHAVSVAGNSDIFILSLDNSGNFRWVKTMGSVNDDHGKALAFDHLGNILNVGNYNEDVLFDSTTNTILTFTPLWTDSYLQKLSQTPSTVTEFGSSAKITPYPNPTHERLFFNFNNAEYYQLEVYDLSGACQMRCLMNNSNNSISMEQLQDGFYFIKLINLQGLTTQFKIVKN